MQGSERQVEWAKSIKSEKHINAMCDAIIQRAKLTETGVQKVEEFRIFLLTNDDAKFWIENKAVFNCHSESYIDFGFNNAMEFFKEYLTKVSANKKL